jgi:cell division protein FtsB
VLITAACPCLLQVRSLREELLAARRERAMTEAREAELRREIASLKRQVRWRSWMEHECPSKQCLLW